MQWLRRLIRHHRREYHAFWAATYFLTVVPILVWYYNSIRLVLAISIETALATHLAGWAADEAAEPSRPVRWIRRVLHQEDR